MIVWSVTLGSVTGQLRGAEGENVHQTCPPGKVTGCGPLDHGQVAGRRISDQVHLLQEKVDSAGVTPVKESRVTPGVGCHPQKIQGQVSCASAARYHIGYHDGCGLPALWQGRAVEDG